jgi:undecaprenyl-diphosphatase
MGFQKFISLKQLVKEFATKEIKVLLILLALFLSVLIFIEIGNSVSEGTTKQFDESIIKYFRVEGHYSEPVGPDFLKETMRDITSLGGETVITLITIFVIGFLLLQKRYDTMWLVLAATVGGALISLGLKELYGRDRPDLIYRLVEVTSLSFPSGHSMMSAIVYLTQAAIVARIQRNRKIRIYILSVALFLTFIIGLSRVYLGVHYPTDVLGGWVIGLAWASFCWFIALYLERKRLKQNISVEN